ncbi:Cholesterol 25-hydroxylase-like protein [Cladochytrium tenue]|nr:Cholesterol 25-hydroxylase-like protein [Cladochytrium tenue]
MRHQRAYLVFRGVPLSFDLNLLSISSYLIFYMMLHDTWFYFMHLEAHRFKLWYRNFHLRHHTMCKELNVFHVGFANHIDNFIDVAPGLFGYFVLTNVSNFWLAVVPLTTVIATASIGHSGYRSHWTMTMMHPLAMPVLVILGRLQLLASPGDHQMHHEHYTCNFGLFFRTWDHLMGTYRHCDLPAYAYGEGPWEAKAVDGQNATK